MNSKNILGFVLIFCGLVSLFAPFLSIMLDFNESAKTTEPWQCNNSCEISLRNSSAISTYKSFSLDISSALFVNFSAYNVSLKASNHILDPLNLVWVESIDAPFLSLDLGFNVYSFGLLSRKIHHMKVVIDEDARSCLWDMNYTCGTKALSTAYLRHVTEGRGVLCHAMKDLNLKQIPLRYQCCRANGHSRQIECGIPALISSDMAAIFKIVVVVVAIALLYFPCLWDNFPDEDSSKTLSCNYTQICINPAYQISRHFMKAIRRCVPSNWANFVKSILIGIFMPILYYIYLFERCYIMKYEIPEMLNDVVAKTGYGDPLDFPPPLVAVFYHIGVVFYTVPKLRQEFKKDKDFRINWTIPFKYTLNFVWNTWCEEGRLAKCEWLLKILISPFVFGVFLTGYTCYLSPTARAIDFVLDIFVYCTRRYFDNWKLYGCCVSAVFIVIVIIVMYLSVLSFAIVLWASLLLISRHIVYVLMGLVANNDYLPLFTLFFVFGYYVWDCFNNESRKHQKLLEQTFEKCKQQQEGQAEPTVDPALQFDEEGAPRISTKLFQKVIDKILPLSEVYTKIFLKIIIILSFLLLAYFSILVYGKSSLNDYTRALAVFLGAIIPKLVEIYRNKSSQLLDFENSYKIEKIVNDFINSGNGMPRDHLPERSFNGYYAIDLYDNTTILKYPLLLTYKTKE